MKKAVLALVVSLVGWTASAEYEFSPDCYRDFRYKVCAFEDPHGRKCIFVLDALVSSSEPKVDCSWEEK